MRKYITYFLLIAATMILGGCVIPMSPRMHEVQLVTPISGDTKELVVKEPMIFGDAFVPRYAIRFSPGTYPLVAEDSENLYFRAPIKIEYRVFENDGSVQTDSFLAGGIFLAKASFSLVPAGAYLSGNEHTNVLIWKLGSNFMMMKDSKWTKNF